MEKTTPSTTGYEMPVAPIAQSLRVMVSNPREFRPEGKSEIYYSADAELATPGHRWSTLRLTVRHSAPVPTGVQEIVLDGFDLKKGEGAAHVVVR